MSKGIPIEVLEWIDPDIKREREIKEFMSVTIPKEINEAALAKIGKDVNPDFNKAKTIQIPALTEKDIQVRVQSIYKTQSGIKARLLLYKDARCDMRILDKVFGMDKWQRSHEIINGNLFCTVSVFIGGQWVSKQDVGTESNTEKEKGQASDAFKRACTNWGIGQELYTPLPLWATLKNDEYTTGGKYYKLNSWIKFSVRKLEVSPEKEITDIIIVDQTGEIRYKHVKQK